MLVIFDVKGMDFLPEEASLWIMDSYFGQKQQ